MAAKRARRRSRGRGAGALPSDMVIGGREAFRQRFKGRALDFARRRAFGGVEKAEAILGGKRVSFERDGSGLNCEFWSSSIGELQSREQLSLKANFKFHHFLNPPSIHLYDTINPTTIKILTRS